MARRLVPVLLVFPVLLVAAAGVQATRAADEGGTAPPPAEVVPPESEATPQFEPVAWRRSRSLGRPWAGRLVGGVRLPAEGTHFFTWDPVFEQSPNRPWRRWGTSRLLRIVLRVVREHRAAYSFAPRVGIADISRPRGGNFGRRFGGLGHASHQNGLDVDIVYPRLDGLELAPERPALVDLELSQDLVDRFVAAGAEYVFVGPRTPLAGPRKVVVPLRHHDDHMHVRIRPR